ncbi:MAG TPA: hypothetical protein VF021_06610 [Longimicrobiales bacterium]
MRRVALLLLLSFHLGGCIPRHRVERTIRTPAELQMLDSRSEYLKVHMRDGSLLVLQKWARLPDTSAIEGRGVRLDVLRDTVERGQLRAPIDSVLLFETNVLRTPTVPALLTLFTAVTGGIAIYCATTSKACFGSCPTFYAGDQARIVAEGFSASIAPALEATDVDRIEIDPVHAGRFDLRMTNEAYETHVIRSVRLLAFPAQPGEEVYSSGSGFWRVSEPIAPRCSAAEGSCTDAVAAADGVERYSVTDSADLAARELLELTFPVAEAGDYALIITSRQTLVHTFVLYQTLAYLGTRAGEFIASLSRGDSRHMRAVLDLGRTMGGIEIGRPDGNDFLATLYETGPLATDSHLVLLGPLSAGEHSLEIRMARGHWRIDRIALARVIAPVEPVVLLPRKLVRNSTADTAALRDLVTGRQPLVSLPGDEFRIAFDVPAAQHGHTLFLESRGYYLEWMRAGWLREEDAAKADMMLHSPAAGLKALAPAFKQWEPRMEQLFWSSRYVRQ